MGHLIVYEENPTKIEDIRRSPRTQLPYEPKTLGGRTTIHTLCAPEERSQSPIKELSRPENLI